MAATNLTISNVALSRVGVAKTITVIDDTTPEGRAINALFTPLRETLLTRYPWHFAQKRAFLTQVAEWTSLTTNTRYDSWAFWYTIPTDLLKAHGLWQGDRWPPDAEREPFEIAFNTVAAVNVLYCDLDTSAEAPVELLYTYRLTDPGLFSPEFTDCLQWMLAAELALVLPVKEGLAARLFEQYERAFARATSLTPGFDIPPDVDLISVRG